MEEVFAGFASTPFTEIDPPTPSAESGPAPTTLRPEHSTPSSEQGITRNRRRPVPRKGHTKSRKGCSTCKGRKVKCPENFPECSICQRLGLTCKWPQAIKESNGLLSASPPPSRPLQTTPTTFSMEDLRFLQHFLFHAYPPLPLAGKMMWRDIVAMSHGVRETTLHMMDQY